MIFTSCRINRVKGPCACLVPCQPAVVVFFVVVFSLFFSLLMISGVCTCSRFAYIEFVDKSSITQALDLDDSLFKGRQIKVSLPTYAQHMIVMWYNNSQQVVTKRTNRPGVSTTNRGWEDARERAGWFSWHRWL